MSATESPEQRLLQVTFGERQESNVDLRIVRVWRMRKEVKRLHYILEDEENKTQRRLYEDEGSELYRILEAQL